jgi:D-glycero-alpha-D-manno-heptose-7-phosphate kinase
MSKMITVTGTASCRVDLAGGTLDLWPLYLHLDGIRLVNMAINVQSTAIFKAEQSKKLFELTVKSRDFNVEREYTSLESLHHSLTLPTSEHPTRWLARVAFDSLVRAKIKTGRYQLECSSQAPPGSGLGGSSTLGVCVAHTIQSALKSPALRQWDLQQRVRDLEAAEIEHPAGDQDYVPAIFGGLLVIGLGPHQRSVVHIDEKVAQTVSNRIALLYTGQPHHSGLNNWTVFRAFHEGDNKTQRCLFEIKKVAELLAADLQKKDTSRLSQLIALEWELRQELSPAMNAPVLGDAWSWAQSLGAEACKACGAGGGGSLLVVFKNQKARDAALAIKPKASWAWLSSDVSFSKVSAKRSG